MTAMTGDKSWLAAIGERMKFARIKSTLTQTDAAELIGVAANTYAKYEQGRVAPSLRVFHRICHCLRVTSDYLLGQDPGSLPPPVVVRDDSPIVRSIRRSLDRTPVPLLRVIRSVQLLTLHDGDGDPVSGDGR